MRRWICLLCVVMLLVTGVSAAAPEFEFALSVDGKTEKTVSTGDIITVTFTLENRAGSYTMYGMQNETRYDTGFFRLVPGSVRPRSVQHIPGPTMTEPGTIGSFT